MTAVYQHDPAYRCRDCDVQGLGYRCWYCGAPVGYRYGYRAPTPHAR